MISTSFILKIKRSKLIFFTVTLFVFSTAQGQTSFNNLSPEKRAEQVAALEKAADNGNADAMFFLAYLYFKGDGVTKDSAEGVR